MSTNNHTQRIDLQAHLPSVEEIHRQLRKGTKNKAAFPTLEGVRKLLYLAHQNITKKWTMPIQNWAKILNQLAIRFEGRFPIE